MKSVGLPVYLAGLAFVLGLSGCAAQPAGTAFNAPAGTGAAGFGPGSPLPRIYGLYAVNGGALIRLNGSKTWERRTWSVRDALAPEVNFIVFSRRLASDSQPLSSSVLLERVASVRYKQTASGSVIPYTVGARWASPNLPAYRIPLEFAPVPNQPSMIVAVPQEPLTPGLYSLKLLGKAVWNSRFGIAWSSVAVNQYAAQNCVDKFLGGYRPCGAVPTASSALASDPIARGAAPVNLVPAATERFAVRDLRSARVVQGDGARTLVIEGELVNTSSVRALMPALAVSLLGPQGTVVQALPAVTLPGRPLDPGGVYNFRINVSNAASGATGVRVTPTA
ncbi:MAG: hypothetical protein M0002_01460 [Rhodospirillales bacterium]|nr:hypothetical protein [Rhodospirillales bacterium]